MVFLLAFLLPAFFRGARFVVLAGLLSSSLALSAAGEGVAVLVWSDFTGFAASTLSAGLAADGFESDLPGSTFFASAFFESAFFESAGLVSGDLVSDGLASVALIFGGLTSAFGASVDAGFLVAELDAAASTDSGFEDPVEARAVF